MCFFLLEFWTKCFKSHSFPPNFFGTAGNPRICCSPSTKLNDLSPLHHAALVLPAQRIRVQILSQNCLLLNAKVCNWHWKCLLASTDLALLYRLQKIEYAPRWPSLLAENATSNRVEQITRFTAQSNTLQCPCQTSQGTAQQRRWGFLSKP